MADEKKKPDDEKDDDSGLVYKTTQYSPNGDTYTEDHARGLSYEGDPRNNPSTDGPVSQGDMGGGATLPSAPAQHTGKLLDDVLAYPKAFAGGVAQGWNTSPILPGHIDGSAYDADMGKHPNVAAAGSIAGIAPTLLPGVPTGNTIGPPAPSADSKLGAQEADARPPMPPPPGLGNGNLNMDVLNSLIRGAQPVPMQHMRTAGIDAGFTDQQKAANDAADAQVKANDETNPLNKNLADFQKGIGEKYGPKAEGELDAQIDARQRMAKAIQDHENFGYDKDGNETSDPAKQVHKGMYGEHYWDSLSTPKKIWTEVSQIIGGLGSGITGGPNLAAQRVQQAIERDTAAQLENRKAHKDDAEMYKGLAGVANQNFSNAHAQAQFINATKLGETAAMVNYIAGKYADPQIKARAADTVGKLKAAQDEAYNKAVEAQNKATVESAHAGAMLRQTATDQVRQALEVQKFNQNNDARYVQGYGMAPTAEEARDIRAKLADNAAARKQLANVQQTSAGTHPWSFDSTVTANRAAIEGLLAHLPKEQADQLRSELGSGRFADQKDALAQIDALLKTNQQAELGRLPAGALGNSTPYKSQQSQ